MLCHFEDWKVIRAHTFEYVVVVVKIGIYLHSGLIDVVWVAWRYVSVHACVSVAIAYKWVTLSCKIVWLIWMRNIKTLLLMIIIKIVSWHAAIVIVINTHYATVVLGLILLHIMNISLICELLLIVMLVDDTMVPLLLLQIDKLLFQTLNLINLRWDISFVTHCSKCVWCLDLRIISKSWVVDFIDIRSNLIYI